MRNWSEKTHGWYFFYEIQSSLSHIEKIQDCLVVYIVKSWKVINEYKLSNLGLTHMRILDSSTNSSLRPPGLGLSLKVVVKYL